MYGSLILFLNRRCTVGCVTCNVDAQPGNRQELSPTWLEFFFNKLKSNSGIFSGYILWTGGEPFLSFNSLEAGIRLAVEADFHSEILTSGIWHQHFPHYLDILAKMVPPVLRISLDAEHQQKVKIDALLKLIEHALSLDFEVNFTLREIPGQPESPQKTMLEIEQRFPQFYAENKNRSRWLHYIPHIPIPGKPSATESESALSIEPPNSPVQSKHCRMAYRDLVIGADGLIYPCCGFFAVPGHHRMASEIPTGSGENFKTFDRKNHRFFTPCERCVRENLLTL